MMNLKLVLATLLLLAPVVYGCVVFQAAVGTGKCDEGVLYSGVVDNGVTTCIMKGKPAKDKLYHYSCSAKYSATFDTSKGDLKYYTDHGNFTVIAHNAWGVKNVWTACDFDCVMNKESTCWVKSWAEEGCDLNSPPPHKAPAPSPHKAPAPSPHKAHAPSPHKAPALPLHKAHATSPLKP